MINRFPELIPETIMKRVEKLCPTLLCDGMKTLGIPGYGCMAASINAVDPSMKAAGTAVTVETSDGDNFPIHLATYGAKEEGYMMVIDGKNYQGCAYLGDLIMGAAKAVGYAGIVLDGYSRDREGNIELGFPVFSRGLMPAGPVKKNPGVVNGSVLCGGIQVNPGDLIVADCDGVCAVPRDLIEEVLDKAEEKLEYETKRAEVINAYNRAKAAGEELPQLAPQWALDMLGE